MTDRKNRRRGRDFAKFPVYFPVSREFGAETGPIQTAASGRESCSNQTPRFHLWAHFGVLHRRNLMPLFAFFFGERRTLPPPGRGSPDTVDRAYAASR